jgi:hypothetical protein
MRWLMTHHTHRTDTLRSTGRRRRRGNQAIAASSHWLCICRPPNRSALNPMRSLSSRREDKPANVLNIHCLEELLLTLKQLELSDTLVVCYYWKFNCYACKSVAPKVRVPPRRPDRCRVG